MPAWSANRRGHWSQRASAVAAWRAVTRLEASRAKIPPLGRVAVTLIMTPADRRRRDADGIAGVLKPALDGLVDAGIIPDDSWRWVPEVTLSIADPDPSRAEHGWVLLIDELEPREEAA